LAVLDLGDALDGDDDLPEELVEPLDLDAALDRLLDRLLAAALHLDDVPVLVARRGLLRRGRLFPLPLFPVRLRGRGGLGRRGRRAGRGVRLGGGRVGGRVVVAGGLVGGRLRARRQGRRDGSGVGGGDVLRHGAKPCRAAPRGCAGNERASPVGPFA